MDMEGTPSRHGYYMPAECVPHSRCWIGWPERPGGETMHGQSVFARVASEISKFEPVTLCASAAQVLKAVNQTKAVEVAEEILDTVFALRNTRGLPWPKDKDGKDHKKKINEDILDWLQAMFGFQTDNVAKQREHLILLVANVHIRQLPKFDHQPKLDDRALTVVMKKRFKNYKRWCKYLGRKSSLW